MKLLPKVALASPKDALEYREDLTRYQSGEWDNSQWTGFRVRYGIYGQRQAEKHMVRIKVPGGLLPVSWLPVIASGMKAFGGDFAHLTTRQDIQLYDVSLSATADLLDHLHGQGVATRESGGNTVRNITACPLAGQCADELVDAGQVAQSLAGLWLRSPIAQRMPRKFKIAVSGCGKDCAGGWFHDLAFVAQKKDGENGFRILGGGGLGARPMPGVELFDFVTEQDLPAVIEAVLRVHQHRSDRANKAASRFKFTLRRLNAEEIKNEVAREFEVARQLPQRPLPPIAWRKSDGARLEDRPVLKIRPQNGQLSSAQLLGLYDLAKANGLEQLRLTIGQELVIEGLSAEQLASARLWLKGFNLPEADGRDLVGCLGTSTCPVGVGNAAGLIAELDEIEGTEGVTIRASGCHNACAQHHVADIGLHGLTRVVGGKPVPHYQFHLGGDLTKPDGLALEGPAVPARQVPAALRRLLDGLAATRQEGESVRAWAERLGEGKIGRLIGEASITQADHIDWGDDKPFAGPAGGKADCAAPVVNNDHLADLAKDALERMDRAQLAGLWQLALREGERAISLAAQRQLERDHRPGQKENAIPVIERLRSAFHYRPAFLDALERIETTRQIALVTGKADDHRQAIADWLEEVESASPEMAEKSNVGFVDLEKKVAGL
jgi:sulfite reductase (NADPH) hemoprotein beta-component